MKRMVMNVYLVQVYVVTGLLPPIFLGRAAIGLFAGGRRGGGNLFVLLCSRCYMPLFLIIAESRIFLPLLPLALIWAAFGVVAVEEWLKGYGPSPFAKACPVFVLAAIDSDAVAFVRPRVDYYTKTRAAGIPVGPVAEGLAAPKRSGVTHLVVDSRILSSVRPHGTALADPTCAPPERSAVCSDVDETGTSVVVYRIR